MQQFNKGRLVILGIGLVAGMALSSFWPHEPALANSTDRAGKFAITTCEMMDAVISGNKLEGVFVLDFLTGQLTGGVMNNRTGRFQIGYTRNVAADFQIDVTEEPQYALVSGVVNLPGQGGATPAAGVIYVAELTSGQVRAYAMPYRAGNQRNQMLPMNVLDAFAFRQ